MSRRETLISSWRQSGPLIAPSMLKCDFGNLHREVELLEAAASPVLHWDVMDGHFVPNLSYGPMVIERVRSRTSIPFDAHLMISEPGRYLDEYLKAGCDAVTFHIESEADPQELLHRIRHADCVAGLAVNPNTPWNQVAPLLDDADLLLIMSVQPGFGGQAFIPEVLDKVREARTQAGDRLVISMDGGINAETIGACAGAGTDLFVAGSAVFGQPDYRAAVASLTQLAADALKRKGGD